MLDKYSGKITQIVGFIVYLDNLVGPSHSNGLACKKISFRMVVTID